jgi:O-methyltransferase
MELNECLKWYPINLALSSEAVMRNLLGRLLSVLSAGVPGDVVEMGCHAGDTSVFFARMLQELAPHKTLHLYDSFHGLPDKDEHDNPNYGDPGSVKTAAKIVRDRFAKENLPKPKIHSGWFKDLTDKQIPNQVCFGFFDGDFYGSIMDSFRKIYPKTASGGMLCVHDYGCQPWPGVTRACEDYLSDKPERVEPVCYLLGAMVKQ